MNIDDLHGMSERNAMASQPIAPSTPAPAELEVAARGFAAMDRDEAEAVIDAHVATAVREWRVADASFWQRVKFRSRMIRTASAHRPLTS